MARLSQKTGKHGRPTGERGQTRFRLADPYMPKGGWQEPTICSKCGAVFSGKQWSLDKKLIEKSKKDPYLKYAKCPGCRKVEDHYVMGMLYLSGDFLKKRKNEILSTLKNEERRAMQKNPPERFIAIHESNDSVIIETTTDQLALRLGRFLHTTFSGNMKIKFTPDQKFVRIFWER